MADFGLGDAVCFVENGAEHSGTIIVDHGNGNVVVQGDDAYSSHTVQRSRLLRPKGPFFDVRGLVLTTSATHSNEVGEIVAVGKSASGKGFYKVKFAIAPKIGSAKISFSSRQRRPARNLLRSDLLQCDPSALRGIDHQSKMTKATRPYSIHTVASGRLRSAPRRPFH